MQKVQKQCARTIVDFLSPYVGPVEADIDRWLVEPGTPAELAEAMAYCTAGGKRIRPALVYLAAETIGDANEELVRRAAVAVELVHVYSLVHDDLPAMDDDDLRRGRPTAHVKFGQAMAILVGDALLTRAFGVLGDSHNTPAGRLVGELAAGAGATGMVAGQVADMELCEIPPGTEGLRYIHARKTAALLRASVRMGAIAAAASDEDLSALTTYAENLGLAFQLFDDLLDATGTAEQLGKTPGKDAGAGKRTYLAELGHTAAGQLGRSMTEAAREAVAHLGERADALNQLAELLAQRTS